METYFDHEKLVVYQKTIRFIAWVNGLLRKIKSTVAAKDQLERASTSVALNIAEGNGKFSMKDRCRFWQIARGSAMECAACLDVFMAKQLITEAEQNEGKQQLREVVRMLMGLMKQGETGVKEADEEYEVTSGN
ncbi:MAG: four helix bundle protein [Gammaproteobacteria bacterium]|nr:four helix bundle protein [Gammaproteobacteria bacterium]